MDESGPEFALLAEGKFEEALGSFEAAVARDPKDAMAWFGRGCARHHRRETDEALSDYEEALRLDPRLAHALVGRGSLRLDEGDVEAAIGDYTRAIEAAPQDPAAYHWRAEAWRREGDLERAVADSAEAVRLSPSVAPIRLHRALILHEAGREEEAVTELDEALRLDPRLAAAYKLRSVLRQEQGDHGGAQEDFRRASEIDGGEGGAPAMAKKNLIATLLHDHFGSDSEGNLTITERIFPYRVRADLQRAVERLFGERTRIVHFCGVLERYSHEGLNLVQLLAPDPHRPAVSVPPEHEEMDVGEAEPVRCLKNGLWLLEEAGRRFAVLLAPAVRMGQVAGVKFQIATANDPEGTRIQHEFFRRLEESVLRSESYRGKILSLECQSPYSGESTGILVHRLRTVGRDEVILPRRTLDLLDRNVIGFARQRRELARFGLSTKKGLLFYGPPGTGKTHTIHYLAGALEGHTTFLVTAEQMGLLSEYMTLARLLQPSVVVIEDVDLIARQRGDVEGCEIALHQLLNEMDGLRPDADVLFILTTNRPESLERALASRPGRVDQAIEFPLPDAEGREKLVRLYACALPVPEAVVRATVKRTENVSASFIKELMRRSAQFHLERGGSGDVTQEDVGSALEELLFTGGSLNRKLLGAAIEGPEAAGA